VKLRNHIAYIHRQIPHTDPESDEGKLPESKKHHLHLWKPNEYPQDAEIYMRLIQQKYSNMEPEEQSVYK